MYMQDNKLILDLKLFWNFYASEFLCDFYISWYTDIYICIKPWIYE